MIEEAFVCGGQMRGYIHVDTSTTVYIHIELKNTETMHVFCFVLNGC